MNSSASVFSTDGKNLNLKSSFSKNAVQVGEANYLIFQLMWIAHELIIINAAVLSSVLKYDVALQQSYQTTTHFLLIILIFVFNTDALTIPINIFRGIHSTSLVKRQRYHFFLPSSYQEHFSCLLDRV